MVGQDRIGRIARQTDGQMNRAQLFMKVPAGNSGLNVQGCEGPSTVKPYPWYRDIGAFWDKLVQGPSQCLHIPPLHVLRFGRPALRFSSISRSALRQVLQGTQPLDVEPNQGLPLQDAASAEELVLIWALGRRHHQSQAHCTEIRRCCRLPTSF